MNTNTSPAAPSYAGEVTPQATYQALNNRAAVLVDVRTPEEWVAVGLPDVSGTPSRLVTLSWKVNPGYVLNPNFGEQFAAAGIDKDTPIYFMCKGGGRSLEAAVALTAAGYAECYNVTGGYESAAGWKAAGLPCKVGA